MRSWAIDNTRKAFPSCLQYSGVLLLSEMTLGQEGGTAMCIAPHCKRYARQASVQVR
jgi:hypothetical protein